MQKKYNNEEVLYNVNALTNVWFEKCPEISDLRLIFCHDSISTIIPCTKASCVPILVENLLNNSENYTKAVLKGKVDREDKVIGELDIV